MQTTVKIPHEAKRLQERTKLSLEQLGKLRHQLSMASPKLPKGKGHIRMPDGSFAVVDWRGGKHRIVTFYSINQTPPGTNFTTTVRGQ